MRSIFSTAKQQRAKIKLIGYILSISFCFVSAVFANDILRLNITGESPGTIDILLNDTVAPRHVERLRLLTLEKKYDGVAFHRVIPGFMAQTGDVKFGNINNFEPSLVGMGGSDYPMLKEEFSDEKFLRGTVGMARSRDPNSANSQFFIMFEPAPHLDGQYTIVGEVIAGLDVVLGIKKGTSVNNGSVKDPDFILTAEILEKD